MKFLEHVAEHLYSRRLSNISADEIVNLRIVFPTRRARIYFAQHLSRIAERPLWLPANDSIDRLFEHISNLREANRYVLVAELFRCYKQAVAELAASPEANVGADFGESFEKFFYWGDLMLRDFDALDKYLVKIDPLLRNLRNIKDLQSNDLSFLSEEQLSYLKNFWENVETNRDLPQKFCDFWDTLKPTYDKLHAALRARGLGYTGMIYREAVERIGEHDFGDEQYVFVGFGALSACEEKLFAELQKRGKAEFYWDYDRYYLDSDVQEAGMFARRNLKNFPPADADDDACSNVYNCFAERKNISVVECPSELMQAKILPTLFGELEETLRSDSLLSADIFTPNTAVVLTNENLLTAVLYSLGDDAGTPDTHAVNITMGYPLAQTSAYSLLEFVVNLQKRVRGTDEAPRFYHKDVLALLKHEYVHALMGRSADALQRKIVEQNMAYLSPQKLAELLGSDAADASASLAMRLFERQRSYRDFIALLQEVLSKVANIYVQVASGERNGERTDTTLQRASVLTCARSVNQLGDALAQCGEVEISVSMVCGLLLAALKTATIPFEGEPVSGLQVMGILETRLLDFDNLFVLSLNEDTFPSVGNVQSLLPYNLRRAYGLPAIEESEALNAYYFYRLVQRAQNVALLYNGGGGDNRSGEMTRYLHQLLAESPRKEYIAQRLVGLDIPADKKKDLVVQKDEEILGTLAQYTSGKRPISASAMKLYMSCPMRFYLACVLGLQEDKEVEEGADALLLGNAFHGMMEELYGRFIGHVIEKRDIEQMLADKEGIGLRAAYHTAKTFINKNAPSKSEQREPNNADLRSVDENGELYLLCEVLKKYAEAMLAFDLEQAPFRILALEEEISYELCFADASGRPMSVRLRGFIDRVDEQNGTLKIIDYKTGGAGQNAAKLRAEEMDDLFASRMNEQRHELFQTMLYALATSRSKAFDESYRSKKIAPKLYFLRELAKTSADIDGTPRLAGAAITDASQHFSGFEQQLQSLLCRIFDPATPFTQTDDERHCAYCDFAEVCGKG